MATNHRSREAGKSEKQGSPRSREVEKSRSLRPSGSQQAMVDGPGPVLGVGFPLWQLSSQLQLSKQFFFKTLGKFM